MSWAKMRELQVDKLDMLELLCPGVMGDILKEAKEVPKHVDFKFRTKADEERDVDDDLGESDGDEADVAGIISLSFLLCAVRLRRLHFILQF